MREEEMWHKKCGMEECKVTPHLKYLIARFLSIMAPSFLLNL